MQSKRLIVGCFQENTYIVSNHKECILIDPGANGKKIKDVIYKEGLSLIAILLTHGHMDHIGAVDYLYDNFQCPIYIHKEDMPLLYDANLNLSYLEKPFIIRSPIIDIESMPRLLDTAIKYIHLPGHTPGSCVFHFVDEKVMFTGDVLFQGSIGRYDFPLSSKADMIASINKIKSFPFDAKIYPGHGEATSLSAEKSNNPFLQ